MSVTSLLQKSCRRFGISIFDNGPLYTKGRDATDLSTLDGRMQALPLGQAFCQQAIVRNCRLPEAKSVLAHRKSAFRLQTICQREGQLRLRETITFAVDSRGLLAGAPPDCTPCRKEG
ncbi:hypothetical protein [Tabrizicola sp. YIM 78059]|uniref:hypothetical protein n=1 Tax=Tabrizicola sp. YIM 78059 TaxID=2529861 RepID=UPI0010AA6CB0|nr:hypothetical protein [Tabrizicola sp. YIM 78059]